MARSEPKSYRPRSRASSRPNMERRHFEFLAAVMADSALQNAGPDATRQHHFICGALAFNLHSTNSNFKPGTFMEACGWSEEKLHMAQKILYPAKTSQE